MERWSEYWCIPLNPSKCEPSFFSVDPHQANLQPNLLLLGSRLRFNPTPTFLGVTFDRTLSFFKHVSSLKAKFFPCLKALRCISASSCGPSKESLFVLYKSFVWPLLTHASPGWFPFLSATNLNKLERLHQAASCAITDCLLSSPIPLLLTEASLPPLRVTLTHFTLFSYERALCLSTEELVLPGHARCVLSRLRCNGHSLLLGSYLSRIGRIKNPSCSACGHPSQNISHLIPHCPATDSLCCSLFGDSLSVYDLWSILWGVAQLLELHGLLPCPHPSEGVE